MEITQQDLFVDCVKKRNNIFEDVTSYVLKIRLQPSKQIGARNIFVNLLNYAVIGYMYVCHWAITIYAKQEYLAILQEHNFKFKMTV